MGHAMAISRISRQPFLKGSLWTQLMSQGEQVPPMRLVEHAMLVAHGPRAQQTHPSFMHMVTGMHTCSHIAALHMAAANGHLEVVNTLLSAGAVSRT